MAIKIILVINLEIKTDVNCRWYKKMNILIKSIFLVSYWISTWVIEWSSDLFLRNCFGWVTINIYYNLFRIKSIKNINIKRWCCLPYTISLVHMIDVTQSIFQHSTYTFLMSSFIFFNFILNIKSILFKHLHCVWWLHFIFFLFCSFFLKRPWSMHHPTVTTLIVNTTALQVN